MSCDLSKFMLPWTLDDFESTNSLKWSMWVQNIPDMGANWHKTVKVQNGIGRNWSVLNYRIYAVAGGYKHKIQNLQCSLVLETGFMTNYNQLIFELRWITLLTSPFSLNPNFFGLTYSLNGDNSNADSSLNNVIIGNNIILPNFKPLSHLH